MRIIPGKSSLDRNARQRALDAAKRYDQPFQPLESRQMLAADFVASFVSGAMTLPAASEQAVVIRVDNIGPDQATSKPKVRIYASTDDVLDRSDRLVASGKLDERLTSGAFVEKSFNVRLPASMASGEYRFIATVDEELRIAEEDDLNNTVVSEQVLITAADVDLSGSIVRSKFESNLVADKAGKGELKVSITGAGSASLFKSEKVEVRAFLRPVGASDASRDIAISSSKRQSVKSLMEGEPREVSLSLKIPKGLAEGQYQIVVAIDSGNAISESNETNNLLVVEQTLTIAAPRVDVAIASGSIQTARNGELRGLVSFINLGNTRSNAEAQLQFFLVQEGQDDAAISQLVSRKISLKPSGISSSVRIKLSLPVDTVVHPGARVVARMTPSSAMNDADASNNSFDLGEWPLVSQV